MAAPKPPKRKAPVRPKKIIGKKISIGLGLEFSLDSVPFTPVRVGEID